MREYLCIALLLAMILMLIPACGPSEADAAEAAEPRDLSFVIVNNSSYKIDDIGLAGANLPMNFSAIDKGGRSELKNKKLELPRKLTLHWSDSRGERHEGTVDVWGKFGASYSGPVKLTITQRYQVVLTGG